jgi:hypothetical protein
MVERHSGFARLPEETYVTPHWVYELLYSVEPWARTAWDCAPVNARFDFLTIALEGQDIATNPPYKLAPQFCRRAVSHAPRVAMLLSQHFDTAKSRRDLFAECKVFKAKYTLTKRIRWENLIQSSAGPSRNHAWFVWDHQHSGRPFIGWLPT